VETFINFLPKLLSRYADWTLGCEWPHKAVRLAKRLFKGNRSTYLKIEPNMPRPWKAELNLCCIAARCWGRQTDYWLRSVVLFLSHFVKGSTSVGKMTMWCVFGDGFVEGRAFFSSSKPLCGHPVSNAVVAWYFLYSELNALIREGLLPFR
jgi:hypothetical protein